MAKGKKKFLVDVTMEVVRSYLVEASDREEAEDLVNDGKGKPFGIDEEETIGFSVKEYKGETE